MPLHVPVILGTVREGRRSERVARYVHARLHARDDVRAPFVDPAALPYGNLEQRIWEMEDVPAALQELSATVRAADAIVVVSPEYNHGYPGALKNVFDLMYEEWNGKPFAVVAVSNGPWGGTRMVESLWSVVVAVQGIPVPKVLNVPRVSKLFDADGAPTDEKFAGRVEKFLDTVLEHARATRARRAAATPEAAP